MYFRQILQSLIFHFGNCDLKGQPTLSAVLEIDLSAALSLTAEYFLCSGFY